MPERGRELALPAGSQVHEKMKSVAGMVGHRLTIPSTPGDNCFSAGGGLGMTRTLRKIISKVVWSGERHQGEQGGLI